MLEGKVTTQIFIFFFYLSHIKSWGSLGSDLAIRFPWWVIKVGRRHTAIQGRVLLLHLTAMLHCFRGECRLAEMSQGRGVERVSIRRAEEHQSGSRGPRQQIWPETETLCGSGDSPSPYGISHLTVREADLRCGGAGGAAPDAPRGTHGGVKWRIKRGPS